MPRAEISGNFIEMIVDLGIKHELSNQKKGIEDEKTEEFVKSLLGNLSYVEKVDKGIRDVEVYKAREKEKAKLEREELDKTLEEGNAFQKMLGGFKFGFQKGVNALLKIHRTISILSAEGTSDLAGTLKHYFKRDNEVQVEEKPISKKEFKENIDDVFEDFELSKDNYYNDDLGEVNILNFKKDKIDDLAKTISNSIKEKTKEEDFYTYSIKKEITKDILSQKDLYDEISIDDKKFDKTEELKKDIFKIGKAIRSISIDGDELDYKVTFEKKGEEVKTNVIFNLNGIEKECSMGKLTTYELQEKLDEAIKERAENFDTDIDKENYLKKMSKNEKDRNIYPVIDKITNSFKSESNFELNYCSRNFDEQSKDYRFSIKVEDNGENRYCLADKDFSLNKLLMYAMDEKFADTLRITTDVKYENELELQNNKEYSLVSLDKLKEENEKLIEKVDVKIFKESDSSLDKITNKVIANTIKSSIDDINRGKSESILKELKENYEKEFQNQLEKIEDKNSLIEKNAKKFDLTLGDNGKIQEFDTGDKEEYNEMINQAINSYKENNFLEFLDDFEMSKGQKELENLDKTKSNKDLNLETLKDLRNEHLGSKEYNDDLIKIKAFTTAIVLGDEEKLSIDEINKVFNSEKIEDLHIQERTLEKVNEYIEKRSDNIEKFDFVDNKNLLDFKGIYDFQDNIKTKEELSFYKSEKELITEKATKEKEVEKDNRKEQIEKIHKKEVEKDKKENEREVEFF